MSIENQVLVIPQVMETRAYADVDGNLFIEQDNIDDDVSIILVPKEYVSLFVKRLKAVVGNLEV